MSQSIRVLLVEDHELTRQGLSYSLDQVEDIEVAAQAVNGQEAVALAESTRPDVILMDVVLPVMNGIEATQRIKERWPEVKVIMLTSHGEQEKVFSAFTAGADGYCMKEIKTDVLIQVIRLVKDGAVWMDPSIAGYILKAIPLVSEMLQREENKASAQDYDLTEREHEILALIAQGLTNKDISEKLSISHYTVKNHVSSIIQKLAVEDRTQAAILALKKGL